MRWMSRLRDFSQGFVVVATQHSSVGNACYLRGNNHPPRTPSVATPKRTSPPESNLSLALDFSASESAKGTLCPSANGLPGTWLPKKAWLPKNAWLPKEAWRLVAEQSPRGAEGIFQ